MSSQSVLLTFDDGPQPDEAMRSILETLEREGIRAEFYMLGSEVEQSAALVVRAASEGHTIQNHSWSHPDLSTAPMSRVREEVGRTQDMIQRVLGQAPTKIRPPYGAGGWQSQLDPELAHVAGSMGLRIENWDVDTEDWKQPRGLRPKLRMIEGQLRQASRRSPINILMHVQRETATDLPMFIDQLRRWGYGFAEP
ncbi:MAG: polysaccharide deacetylase family protein [Myxococcales bacterium]|nr:polysaccharide deacetylase family protein [Myxococcales bacterium]